MKSCLFSLFSFLVVAVVNGQVADDTKSFSCDLECANGGYCALVSATENDLARMVQSGHLIEKCVCQPGFTGLTCEAEVQECAFPERRCNNGAPCVQDENGDWGCDCSLADSLSRFAGFQCRKPSTEYCTGRYDPTSALSFCTHGGRCVADFFAAQVAPGDTTFNQAYQHRGCRCPPEFQGPHCEFLKAPGIVFEEPIVSVPELPTGADLPITTILLGMLSLSLVVLVMVVLRKKLLSQPVPREITVSHGTPWVHHTNYYSGYNDKMYNGRHITPREKNLQSDSEFVDVHLA